MSLKELKRLPLGIQTFEYPVQIYEGFYLGPKRVKDLDDAEMFNHSCDANAGVKGQNALVARRPIKAGEETCFDYETTDTDNFNFRCCCGAKNCRGKINGSAWKRPEFQKAHKGFFSWYLAEKIKTYNDQRNKLKRKQRKLRERST